MRKRKILFVCVHNSARSQMAEAFLKQLDNGCFEADSAGLEPGTLNPLAVDVMNEIGIDISQQPTNDVFEFMQQERQFDYVITVCDESVGERCPIFPGMAERLHWTLEDPASLSGSYEEKLAKTRMIRDQIRQRVTFFLEERKCLLNAHRNVHRDFETTQPPQTAMKTLEYALYRT